MLTVSEVANQLNVSRALIYREVKSKRLSAYRIRGRIRISTMDLSHYLTQQHDRSTDVLRPQKKHF
ncbi:helix-turn-helix domain-containing protein [Fuerstiella marisgermanici]